MHLRSFAVPGLIFQVFDLVWFKQLPRALGTVLPDQKTTLALKRTGNTAQSCLVPVIVLPSLGLKPVLMLQPKTMYFVVGLTGRGG